MCRSKRTNEVPTERENTNMELTEVDVKQKQIAQHHNMRQSTISNIVRKLKDKSGNNEIEPRGRKKKLSPRDVRMLLKCAKKYRFKSLRYITAEFKKCRIESVSISTMRRVFL